MAWGMAKGLVREKVIELNKGLLKEDLSILIKGIRFTEAQEKQHIHEQNQTLIGKVMNLLPGLAYSFGWQEVETTTIESTHENIWRLVKKFLNSRK
jgi:hypothetical protein